MAEGPLLGLAREPVLRARELQALLLGWLLPLSSGCPAAPTPPVLGCWGTRSPELPALLAHSSQLMGLGGLIKRLPFPIFS